MLMHLIKLLCCSYTFAFSIPMLISVKINHVNFQLLLSWQFQTATVLSISNPCSHVSQFQLVFTTQFVNGQVTSSHPRTACACQFVLVIGQVTSSHPRTACACQFAFIFGQMTSSHPRTACTCQFAFIPVIGQVTSSNTRTACAYQFTFIFSQATSSNTRTACASHLAFVVSQAASSNPRTACAYLLVSILGQVPSSSQKNNLCLSICYLFPQWILLFVILLMSTSPAMDATYPVICYPVNVY